MTLDQFRKGQRVRVVRASFDGVHDMIGRELTVDRIERAHGFVVAGCCESDEPRCAAEYHGKWWIYPDTLEIIS